MSDVRQPSAYPVAPVMLALAGVIGAAGVALSAVASHSSVGNLLEPAARMLLAHAPVCLFLSLVMGRGSPKIFAGIALAVLCGLLLFCGDLIARAWWGVRLFPFAAPVGGGLLIMAWVGLAGAGLALLLRSR